MRRPWRGGYRSRSGFPSFARIRRRLAIPDRYTNQDQEARRGEASLPLRRVVRDRRAARRGARRRCARGRQQSSMNVTVTDTPFGDERHMHMGAKDGRGHWGIGHADDADVTLTTDYDDGQGRVRLAATRRPGCRRSWPARSRSRATWRSSWPRRPVARRRRQRPAGGHPGHHGLTRRTRRAPTDRARLRVERARAALGLLGLELRRLLREPRRPSSGPRPCRCCSASVHGTKRAAPARPARRTPRR